jgi:hypothetical protein
VNWKLIFQLSLLGLFMGVATVYLIPFAIEPVCWLLIFLFSAYMIARECASSRFLHGLILGIVNSVWITGAHVLLFWPYLRRHAQEHLMLDQGIPHHPRLMMILMGGAIGVVSGVIIGLLSLVAGKFIRGDNRTVMGQNA